MQMKDKKDSNSWLRLGVLTFTVLSPIVNTILEQLRKRSQSLYTQASTAQDGAQNVQARALQSLDELTLTSRQRAAEQAKQLQMQATHLQSQARLLRDALRDEARQQRRLRKLTRQLSQAGLDWRQELRKRGGHLTEGLVEQGNKLSHEVIERGSKVTHDLAEQGNRFTQDMIGRGTKVTQDIAERGGELIRKRSSRFWTVAGFGVGLVAAGAITYVLIRRRMAEQAALEQGLHIEISSRELLDDQEMDQDRPRGDILHFDRDGAVIDRVQAVEIGKVDLVEQPSDATIVGVISTKRYYPASTPIEQEDIVYFASEDDAKSMGYLPVVD